MAKGINEEIILTSRKRNCNIDLIRIIACFAVVGLHTFPKNLSVSTASLYYLCGFAVPFFFIASGYCLLNRGKISENYSLRKIIGIIRTIVCWNAIVIALKLITQMLIHKKTTIGLLTIPVECVKSLVQKGDMWQFWYMGALLMIYILLAPISRCSRKKKQALMLTAGIVAVTLEAVSVALGSSVQLNVIQTFRIWTWVFYFVLGSEISWITETMASKIDVGVHIFIVFGVTIINLAYQNYAGIYLIAPDNGVRLHAEYFYDSLIEMIWIVFLFSLLLRVNISDNVRAFVEQISPLTMGIYIIHPLLQRCIVKLIGAMSLGKACMYWIITLLGAAVITWIIYKTPMKKYLLKV